MPKWGLTEPQRRARPWGIAEDYLRPAKVVTDPIHGDVYLTELEQLFIDTEPFERLRRIRQLGNTHLVYPGATHSRFAHSLGCVRVAQDLIDAVLDQRNTRKPIPDLFSEWEAARAQAFADLFETSNPAPRSEEQRREVVTQVQAYDRQVGEAVVAARLGALLHDLCHVPFGHSIEDELRILTPHDRNEKRFDRLWERLCLPVELDAQLQQGGLFREVRRLILSKHVDPSYVLRYPFVEDIVGNTICADLLDYLERDHRAAGLPVALGRRFVASFYVTPTGDPETGRHMVLRIGRAGRERTDIVTEVLKYLRYRYELSERVLVHHAKLGADAMVGKALEMWYDVLWLEQADGVMRRKHKRDGKKASSYKSPDWLADVDIDAVRARFEEAHARSGRRRVDLAAREQLDAELSVHGDDTLLERLAELPQSLGPAARLDAIRRLARAILDRELFKPIGTQRHPPLGAEEMVERWGTPDARRRAEEDAADWAELEHRWQVLLWIPPEEMRLKIADVLVTDGDGILTFSQYEERGKNRGSDIYAAHKALWQIAVYLEPTYARAPEERLTRRKVLARLAKTMNITFAEYEKELGKQAYLWPDRLAAREAVNLSQDDNNAADERPALVDDLMHTVRTHQVQARGQQEDESWDALFARYREVADAGASESSTA